MPAPLDAAKGSHPPRPTEGSPSGGKKEPLCHGQVPKSVAHDLVQRLRIVPEALLHAQVGIDLILGLEGPIRPQQEIHGHKHTHADTHTHQEEQQKQPAGPETVLVKRTFFQKNVILPQCRADLMI